MKLKVQNGSHAGTEIAIPGPEFVIGRQEGCDLRPKSETVSRRHCSITLTDSGVVVQDLGSRNGVYVNGSKIEDEVLLKPGDQLRVGKLEFEVLINYGLGASKKPHVASVKDAVNRVAGAKKNDGDIGDWLSEADEVERVRALADPETRQFRLDDTKKVSAEDLAEEEEAEEAEEEEAGETAAAEEKKGDSGFFKRKTKKVKGKLPPRPANDTKDTKEAAANTLRRFFNNR
ncbi:MAG TPA: FHA domain-containing protein [Pirellulaceae bacterium]|nr:FHA domain-containing protein [Pirellulaceae bacterium]